MCRRDQIDRERSGLESATDRNLDQVHFTYHPAIFELPSQVATGKRRRIDRAANFAPQIRHRTKMVFMGMGDHQPVEPVQIIHDKCRVGRHHINARCRVVTEGNSHINHKPAVVITVQAHIHADLASTTERDEKQFLRCHTSAFRA